MNTLTFGFAEAAGANGHQVRPLVDGADLLHLIAGSGEPIFIGDWLGLDPPDFFRQPQLISGGRLFIGRCECGEPGCGSVLANVVRSENAVTWQLDDHRKYEFGLAEYLETIERAAANTDWETVERTAERLVSALDFTPIEEQGFTFEWASARMSPGHVTLSFWTVDAPHQRLIDVEWDGQRPEHAVAQVRRVLEEPVGTAGRNRLAPALQLAVWLLVTLVLGGLIWAVAVAPLRH